MFILAATNVGKKVVMKPRKVISIVFWELIPDIGLFFVMFFLKKWSGKNSNQSADQLVQRVGWQRVSKSSSCNLSNVVCATGGRALILQKNWPLVNQFRLLNRKFSHHFIQLVAVDIRCNRLTRFRKAAVDISAGSPNRH